MIHDARRLEHGAEIAGDVCIVGAGAAGITLARELGTRGVRVTLLESGGFAFRRGPQSLYAGENTGRPSHSTYRSRVRMFGGSTTRWSGMCRPLERRDFEKRAWVPNSGWPFSLDDLDPHYRRAQEVCHLAAYDYEPAAWTQGAGALLPLDPRRLAVRIYQFSHPLDFGAAYREELAASRTTDVYIHANAVEIEVDPAVRRVTGLRVATLEGKRFRATAGHFVLACGGLENPRLLLASNGTAPAGLGNTHDLVGRFFMDHPFFFLGRYDPARDELDRTLHVVEDYTRMGSEGRVLAALALPDETLRRESLTDSVVFFVRRAHHKTLPEYFTRGRQSLSHLADLATGTDLPDGGAGRHLRSVVADLPAVSRSLARQVVEWARPKEGLAVRATLETTPNPRSRVTLGRERDRLGMPRIQVDWRPNPDDLRGLHRMREVMRGEFERLRLGRLVDGPDEAGWPPSSAGGMHHMGTTRMHTDPHHGVVDANGRVHDLANLFVAGSSVFPTGGVANPTLTIVALAIRLADHLVRVVGQERVE